MAYQLDGRTPIIRVWCAASDLIRALSALIPRLSCRAKNIRYIITRVTRHCSRVSSRRVFPRERSTRYVNRGNQQVICVISSTSALSAHNVPGPKSPVRRLRCLEDLVLDQFSTVVRALELHFYLKSQEIPRFWQLTIKKGSRAISRYEVSVIFIQNLERISLYNVYVITIMLMYML